jgi:methionyl-tRNA formyltransferase
VGRYFEKEILRYYTMRIVFVGTVEFSCRMLMKLLDMKENVVGVVTKKYSNFNSDFVDIGNICRKRGLPVCFTKDINSPESFGWIQSKSPDVILCFGWSSLIKQPLLKLPPLGIIGYHPSALPKNRGRHPLIWPLVLDLQETASSFFFMDDGADSGDLISQKKVIISHEDDAATLYDKIIDTALIQIDEFIPHVRNKNVHRIPQDNTNATYWRKRSKSDGQIDWRMSVESIYNLVRALTKPYAGAHFLWKNNEVKVWRVENVSKQYVHIESIEYGKILSTHKKEIYFDVKCIDGVIRILNHSLIALPEEGEYLL